MHACVAQAKLQDLETEVRELRDSAQRLELERSRQEAELDVLRRSVARHSQPASAIAGSVRVEQLEAYVRQLETRQHALEKELDQKRVSEAAAGAAATSATASAAQLEAQLTKLEGHPRVVSAEREAAARVPHFETHIRQLESRLQDAERQAAEQVAQHRDAVRRLEAQAQRMLLDRAKDRAQLDAFHASQLAAAAENQTTVRCFHTTALGMRLHRLVACTGVCLHAGGAMLATCQSVLSGSG